MLVHAKCLAFAWDSLAGKAYNPDAGPLPDGLYEIDTDSQLATLKTLRGDWLFQYPGHQGRPKPEDKPVAATATIKEVVEAKVDRRTLKKGPMSAERKAQFAANLAKARAAKRARLEAAAA